MRNIRIEIITDGPEEILIRTREISEDIIKIQRYAETLSSASSEIELHLGDSDYLIPLSEILFFETSGNRTEAHTGKHIFTTELKLYELEEKLPPQFLRCSKSGIINVQKVVSVKKELTGMCEVRFRNTEKTAYVSRMYFKPFRDALKERTI